MRVMPFTENLPYALYRAEQVREFDRIAIQEFGIPGAELMERAGSRSFQLLQTLWPRVRRITVVCGAGNNGGDGYVVARLAHQAGIQVELLSLGDPARLEGDALGMAEAWWELGGEVRPFDGLSRETELIVDGILGTGLQREVTGRWAEAIEAINRHPASVLAIDIPSGLNSDSGRVMGCAIRADATLSFIGLKQGMFTGAGVDCCGEIHFDALELPARIYARQILAARRIDWRKLARQISPRRRASHKGDLGHLLVVGGNRGFSGAVRLAAEAAARSGAGLVSVATHPAHAACLNLTRPELMCRGVENADDLRVLIERANVIALGPGLGQDAWAEAMYRAALDSGLPLVLDADALNLLAQSPAKSQRWILTPHPGEAARLLGTHSKAIQADRFAALQALQDRFGGVVVLKGAGSLIGGAGIQTPAVCSEGNPGMASGGSGDLLTGIIAALLAQGHALSDAAQLGVALHAAAGDQAARHGEIGMLASDMLGELRPLLNEGCADVES
ncbi:MAG: NAD(P)H-hydrate dehydratase [Gammaproteobacteria bacterium]|nr:NAD(P)H-hydrate dehydratase [Gammaproteobacteria bacterium]